MSIDPEHLIATGAAVNPRTKNGRELLDVAEGEFFQATFQSHERTAELLRKLGGRSTLRTRKDLITPVR